MFCEINMIDHLMDNFTRPKLVPEIRLTIIFSVDKNMKM